VNETCPHCKEQCTHDDWKQMNSVMAHDEQGNAFLQHLTCLRRVHNTEHHGGVVSKTCEFCEFPNLGPTLSALNYPGG
jgi:hypothetical protein